MFKFTAVRRHSPKKDAQEKAQKPKFGFLLINQQDEIIYVNQQARHFLGLLSDEKPPFKQTFMSLVQSAYQCYPAAAWLGWPERPSVATTRHLIYKPQNSNAHLRLKVEILEQITINDKFVWAVAMIAENPNETAVPYSANG